MRSDLGRFQRRITTPDTVERIHWLWVVGSAGAASIAFLPDARAILGRSVVTFGAAHSPRPRDDFDPHGPCEFLEGAECWLWAGSSLGLEPLVVAYDSDAYELIWGWLEGYYDTLLELERELER